MMFSLKTMEWAVIFILAGLAVYTAADCGSCGTVQSIVDQMGDLKFQDGCKAYKTAYDCYDKGDNCDKKELDDAVSGVCKTGSGDLNSCGIEMNTCVALLNDANKQHDKTHACSDIKKFYDCTYKADAACEAKKVKDLVAKLRTQIGEMEMEIGCDGKCAAAVAECVNELADDSTGNMTQQKFKEMCTDLNTANKCIEPLKATVCSKGTANVQLAENIINEQRKSISDICGNNGEPTECAKDFEKCGIPLKTIKGKTTKEQCNILSGFLTCVERLPCHNVFKGVIAQAVKMTDAEELQGNCPIIGGCKERLMTCANRATKELKGVSKETNLDKYCAIGADIEACFNVVRGDQSCKLENLEIDTVERGFFADLGAECGNKTACFQQYEKCQAEYKGITNKTEKKKACSILNKAALCVDSTLHSDTCVRVAAHNNTEILDKQLFKALKDNCGDTICAGCPGTATSLNDVVDSLNFKDACVAYQKSYTCYTSDKHQCPVTGIDNAVKDLCQSGSSDMTSCGAQMNQCMTDLLASQDAAKKKNSKVICSDLKAFYQCTFDAAAKCDKNSKIEDVIEKIRAVVSETEMETGCDGQCAKGVAKCLSTLSKDATTSKGMEKFKEMCKLLDTATTCIDPLKKGDGVCSKGQANVQMAENVIEQQKQSSSDICGNDGKPTECMTEYEKCEDLLKDIKTQSAGDRCKTIQSFVECASSAPCHNTLEATIKQSIADLEDAETKSKCPIIGTCQDRILTCTNGEAELKKNEKDHDKFCQIGSEMDSCFAIVNADNNCKAETIKVEGLEKQLKAYVKEQCGESSSTALQSSLLLIVAGLITYLWK